MKSVSLQTFTVAVSTFFAISLCSTTEARAKQLLTSFVSCQASNTALDEAGISDKMLQDANSNKIVAMKVFSMLPDSNSIKMFSNPIMILTMDGLPGPIKTNAYKIDSIASIKSNSLIELKLDWQKTDSNSPGVESVKTQILLHSGQPVVLGCQRLTDHTLLLIATSEILDPNKPMANRWQERVNVEVTRARLKILDDAIVQFKRDTGRFPTEEEGLRALIEQPVGVQNYPKGGYLQTRQMPKDAWHNDFIYHLNPESGVPFEIISLGADGKFGGEGANADLRSTDAK